MRSKICPKVGPYGFFPAYLAHTCFLPCSYPLPFASLILLALNYVDGLPPMPSSIGGVGSQEFRTSHFLHCSIGPRKQHPTLTSSIPYPNKISLTTITKIGPDQTSLALVILIDLRLFRFKIIKNRFKKFVNIAKS